MNSHFLNKPLIISYTVLLITQCLCDSEPSMRQHFNFLTYALRFSGHICDVGRLTWAHTHARARAHTHTHTHSHTHTHWKLHISSLAKTASMKLCVLRRLCQLISFPSTANSVQGPCPSMYGVLFAFAYYTHTALLDRMESKAFHLINSSPLTECLQSLFLRRNGVSCYILSLFLC